MTGIDTTTVYNPWLQNQAWSFTPTYAGVPSNPLAYGWNLSATGSSYQSEESSEATDVYEANEKEAKERKKTRKKSSGSASEAAELDLTASEERALKNEAKESLEKEGKKNRTSFWASLGLGGLFVSGSIVKGAKVGKNKDVTNMFFAYDKRRKVAKYAQLYNEAPIAMQQAQEEMAKASRKFLNAKNRANGVRKAQLGADYKRLKNIMQTALDSGNSQQVAEATAQLRAANGTGYKKLLKQGKTKFQLARGANLSNVKAVKGNNVFKHLGGGTGVIMGAAFACLSLFFEKDKIKEAYAIDKETGNKQLKQSGCKALAPILGFMGGDAIGKALATRFIKKGATKLATKLATKGACKALGAAIGSFVPGLGTIVGLILGTALDFGLSRLISHKFGDADVVAKAKVDKAKSEDLLTEAYIKHLNGEEIGEKSLEILKNNPTFCAKLNSKIQAEQAAAASQAKSA